jgi:glycine betaine/choline ABC-type transport system substrate-binding protein
MTLKPMLENKDLGNICHEHLEYYTYKSLKYLFETNGLEIFKIEENKINGGSYRIFARHFISGSIEYKESISQIDVINFLRDIDEIKLQVKKVLKDLKNSGKKIYAYGASTKGNVILQYFGLSDKDIIAVADKNPEKYGLYTLTDIPIVSEEVARKEANVFFILPYGFTDEFIRREKDWIMNGGTLISPLPNLRIINKENYAD